MDGYLQQPKLGGRVSAGNMAFVAQVNLLHGPELDVRIMETELSLQG